MCSHRLAGPNGTNFVCRVVAHGEMKFIFGESGLANSSQLLLCKPAVGNCAASSVFSATGFTRPAGWLPALYAVKCGFPFWLRMASARIERAEFPVHRNKTL